MNLQLTAAWFYGALVVLASAWVLRGFVEPLLVAIVIAIASWPFYRRFLARLPRRVTRGAAAAMFTTVVTVFVLGPLLFAVLALVSESQTLAHDLAVADQKGLPVPSWLGDLPLVGPWLASRWQSRLAHPGGLSSWAERADLIAWAQSLGQFTLRHALIILFTILLLFLLYRDGESLAQQLRRMLRHGIGERAESYFHIAARAVRASVNSLLVLALFDGIASGIAYAISGAPHPAVWGAITGVLALVPFLGYAAVAALGLHLAIIDAGSSAVLVLALGSAVLFAGDKVVRPVVAREGTHLPFAFVLMGCLGGFQVLGAVGLVIGPVALTLTRELWTQRIRELRGTPVRDALTSIRSGAAARPTSIPLQRSGDIS